MVSSFPPLHVEHQIWIKVLDLLSFRNVFIIIAGHIKKKVFFKAYPSFFQTISKYFCNINTTTKLCINGKHSESTGPVEF